MERNGSFVGFDGGIQQLSGDDTTIILPVLLGTICALGVGGNALVLAALAYDTRGESASDTAVLLANLSFTDLLILTLCASVRAITYRRRTWTLGHFACRTTEWLQHGCVAGKMFTLAIMGQTRDNCDPRATHIAPFRLKRVLVTMVTIWMMALAFPVTDVIFSKLQVKGNVSVCISELPLHVAGFMRVYSKTLPVVVYVAPVVVAAACNIRAIFRSIPRWRKADAERLNEYSLTFLSVTGANALLLLPEWGTWAWARHSVSCRPSVALLIFAQVCTYLASAMPPAILLTMLAPFRQSLSRLCARLTCRDTLRATEKRDSPPEARAVVISDDVGRVSAVSSERRADAFGRTLPDLEHFWTGRRNTEPPDNNDPFPWERLEQGPAEL